VLLEIVCTKVAEGVCFPKLLTDVY